MAGTRVGGMKAAQKNLASDPNFYKRIGSKGGKNGTTGGFATKEPCYCHLIDEAHTKPMCAGKLGGIISKRPKKLNMETT